MRTPKSGVSSATLTSTAAGATGGQASISFISGGFASGKEFWLSEIWAQPANMTADSAILVLDAASGSTFVALTQVKFILARNASTGGGAGEPQVYSQSFVAPGLKFSSGISALFSATTGAAIVPLGCMGAVGYEE